MGTGGNAMTEFIDLSGKWKYKTDEADKGLTLHYQNIDFETDFEAGDFFLPGSACENGIGKKQEYYSELSKEAVRAPREKYEYIGPLWLQKKVYIPESFDGKKVFLFLERVNIASQVWIDREQIDRQIIELSVPHIYDLRDKMAPGEHIITLRIDNRNLLQIGDMSSGYSIDTQGYWNGIAGKIGLMAKPVCHIGATQIYPYKENDKYGIKVKLTLKNAISSPWQREQAKVILTVITPHGKVLTDKEIAVTLFNSSQVEHLDYEIPLQEVFYWSEFSTDRYTLKIGYKIENENGEYINTDEKAVAFGLRFIQTKDKCFFINERRAAFRGTIDCAQFPITGYPAMDIKTYRQHFEMIKSYGLNLVRFHAWCPPEAAFEAADEVGIYLAVEMPLWLNKDICPIELGDDSIHRLYFTNEAVAISKTYGNHPSFILFSNGNENMGDFELLEDITIQLKALDNRRLYALTSNFDHPVVPCEDFFCACEAYGNKIRIQDIHEKVAKDTYVNYLDAVLQVPVPIISFEVGQYCVYPDVDICEEYTGNMLPVNFDAIRKNMQMHKVYHRKEDYIEASGKLAALLYKEDIEAALRTSDFGGFELLSLTDYTGQSTATVGMLDILYREKGFISSKEFCEFCNCVVPLFEAKRIYEAPKDKYIEGRLSLYDFGAEPIKNPLYEVTVTSCTNQGKEQLFYEEKIREEKNKATLIRIPIDKVKTSVMLKISICVESYVNHWRVFVYIKEADTALRLVSTKEELIRIAQSGESAVVTPQAFEFDDEILSGFIPVFWSPVHFPSRKPCGAMIKNECRIFDKFPTERFPDYQWWTLLEHGKCADLTNLSNTVLEEVEPIVEMVPNFVDNTPSSPLFKAKFGKANIIFCGFDLNREDVVTRAFKNSLAEYLSHF